MLSWKVKNEILSRYISYADKLRENVCVFSLLAFTILEDNNKSTIKVMILRWWFMGVYDKI